MTAAFQKDDGEPGFQIYVVPINGSTITEERFRMDAPSGVRKEERAARVVVRTVSRSMDLMRAWA